MLRIMNDSEGEGEERGVLVLSRNRIEEMGVGAAFPTTKGAGLAALRTTSYLPAWGDMRGDGTMLSRFLGTRCVRGMVCMNSRIGDGDAGVKLYMLGNPGWVLELEFGRTTY